MTTTNPQGEQHLEEQSFVSHLLELRDRLLRMVAVVFVLFVGLFPFANDLYTLLAGPLISHLPEGTGMIATRVIAPFLTPLKLTFVMAIFLAIPYILYQFWAFVAPGLYKHEKRLAMPLVASSAVLFYMGMSFAYFVVFPLLFDILPSMAPDQITVAPDITDYLDFVLTLFFAFGIAFEVPIATIILVWMGMTTPESLAQKRPYIIVGAFCVGMLLTPPDVISQTLLAFPMWILFELGVICSKAFVRERRDREATQAEANTEAENSEPFSPQPEEIVTEPAAGGEGLSPEQSDVPSSASRQPEVIYRAPTGDNEAAPPERSTAPAAPASEFRPVTEEELNAQLDRIESEYDDDADEGYEDDEPLADEEVLAAGATRDVAEQRRQAVHEKLEQVAACRDQEDEESARRLLYEVLAEGDEDQVQVARNILNQLDDDF